MTSARAACVLVTGASKGIGRACVLRLGRAGFHVYAGVRDTTAAAALAAELPGRITPLLLDVTDPRHIAAAALRIEREGGELRGVVNNAGVAIAGPLEFLPIDELRRQLEINVVGQVAVTQAVLPLLRAAGGRTPAREHAGRIVLMSSISGRSSLPFTGAYAASKFALEAVADALRVELHPAGVHVALIEPGAIDTPIWATAERVAARNLARMPAQVHEHYGAALEGVRRRVLRGRHTGSPDRVAAAVLHALTARRPQRRYLVGRDARLRIWLERLPTGLRDALIRAAVRRL